MAIEVVFFLFFFYFLQIIFLRIFESITHIFGFNAAWIYSLDQMHNFLSGTKKKSNFTVIKKALPTFTSIKDQYIWNLTSF